MGITVSVAADNTNLTTVNAVREVLGSAATNKGTEIARLIGAATSAIEEYCGRTFARQTYVETLRGTAHPVLMVTNTPIIGTPTILCDSEVVVDFEVQDAATGTLYRQVGWLRGGWVGWETEPYRVPMTEPLRFTVTYEGGYTLPCDPNVNLPGQIEQACVETVVAWFRNSRHNPLVTSKKVGDLALSYARGDEANRLHGIPPSARALLPRRVA